MYVWLEGAATQATVCVQAMFHEAFPPVRAGVSVLALISIMCCLRTTMYWIHLATAVQPCCHLARKQIVLPLWWLLAKETACAKLLWCLSALPAGERARRDVGCGCDMNNIQAGWNVICTCAYIATHESCI